MPETWLSVVSQLSHATNANLSKVPNELYQFHLFCVPLKSLTQMRLNREIFFKKKNKDEEDAISISSLASLDEDKLIKSRSAMIMFFLCKKKKNTKDVNFGKSRPKYSKFSIKLDEAHTDNKIRTKFLIQALHDIADIFGAHHEKIYAR